MCVVVAGAMPSFSVMYVQHAEFVEIAVRLRRKCLRG